MTELGAWTGLPLDLPPGRHPFDPYLRLLTHVLGIPKAAVFLGLSVDPRPIVTLPAHPDYL